MLILMICRCPGGGMADAEDLKSSGDFSSCGFDSHPGHHFFFLIQKELHVHLSPCTCRVPYDRLGVGSDFALLRADLVPTLASNLLRVARAAPCSTDCNGAP